MRKKLFIVYFIALLALSAFHTADIKAALKDDGWDFGTTITQTELGFKYDAYPSKNGKEAWIYGISGGPHTNNLTLSIPSTIDGRKVTRIGDAHLLADTNTDERRNIFLFTIGTPNNTRIKKIVLPDTIEKIEPGTFSGLPKINTIKIPKNVTNINEYTFYKCKRLKKVILPEKLKELNPLAFYNCPDLKKLKLPSENKAFQLKDKFLIARKNNALVFAMPGGKTLKIPNGIKTIRPNACCNVTASVVHIPASVLELEEDSLTSLNIKDVTVAIGNKTFRKDAQCIYRKKDKSLAVAIVDEHRNLYLSDSIEKITPEYSMVNYNIQKMDSMQHVVFPKNLKSVRYPAFTSVANAKNIYFTGTTPPKLTVPKNAKWMGYAELPIHCNLYVPKDSAKAYKAWYKKYECKDSVKWHTVDDSTP